MKTKLITMASLFVLSFSSYAGSTAADYARSAISLGRVATQCGMNSSPQIKVPPQSVISYAMNFSGLSYDQLMQALKEGQAQSIISKEVTDLQMEIKQGKMTCSSVISLVQRGAAGQVLLN